MTSQGPGRKWPSLTSTKTRSTGADSHSSSRWGLQEPRRRPGSSTTSIPRTPTLRTNISRNSTTEAKRPTRRPMALIRHQAMTLASSRRRWPSGLGRETPSLSSQIWITLRASWRTERLSFCLSGGITAWRLDLGTRSLIRWFQSSRSILLPNISISVVFVVIHGFLRKNHFFGEHLERLWGLTRIKAILRKSTREDLILIESICQLA